MPHAPGWTLATFRLVFASEISRDIFEVVLHYDFLGLPATASNADAACAAADSAVTTGVRANINTSTRLVSYTILLDDGVNQAVGLKPVELLGTDGDSPLPQAVCAIWRKHADGRGRRRFGHSCWPGVDYSYLIDLNTLDPLRIIAYQGVASQLNNPTTLFLLSGTSHVIYHRDLDTRDPVRLYIPHPSLRSNRHRTPGRGV